MIIPAFKIKSGTDEYLVYGHVIDEMMVYIIYTFSNVCTIGWGVNEIFALRHHY